MFYPMARAKTWRAHLRARPLRAQPHALWKLAKNDISEASDMARSARGSARAPIKLWNSNSPIKIDTFSLFDHCHSLKTRRDTESWSLVENWKWNFLHPRFWIFLKFFKNFRFFVHIHETSNRSISATFRDMIMLKIHKMLLWWCSFRWRAQKFGARTATPRATSCTLKISQKWNFWCIWHGAQRAR